MAQCPKIWFDIFPITIVLKPNAHFVINHESTQNMVIAYKFRADLYTLLVVITCRWFISNSE